MILRRINRIELEEGEVISHKEDGFVLTLQKGENLRGEFVRERIYRRDGEGWKVRVINRYEGASEEPLRQLAKLGGSSIK